MPRSLLLLVLALALFSFRAVSAQDDDDNETVPISITSPDRATTFAYGTIKDHALIWNKSAKVLIARVTFTDAELSSGQSDDDTHEFRLPGVSFDEAKGIFFATTEKGEVIPVARITKVLFFKSIETLPNARVRVIHPKGVVTVILEAISPNDPAMHPPASGSNPDATRKVDINQVLN
jgi:hypothetical protein